MVQIFQRHCKRCFTSGLNDMLSCRTIIETKSYCITITDDIHCSELAKILCCNFELHKTHLIKIILLIPQKENSILESYLSLSLRSTSITFSQCSATREISLSFKERPLTSYPSLTQRTVLGQFLRGIVYPQISPFVQKI